MTLPASPLALSSLRQRMSPDTLAKTLLARKEAFGGIIVDVIP